MWSSCRQEVLIRYYVERGFPYSVILLLKKKVDSYCKNFYCMVLQKEENPDRAKNQSDCRICYRARLEKDKIEYCLGNGLELLSAPAVSVVFFRTR